MIVITLRVALMQPHRSLRCLRCPGSHSRLCVGATACDNSENTQLSACRRGAIVSADRAHRARWQAMQRRAAASHLTGEIAMDHRQVSIWRIRLAARHRHAASVAVLSGALLLAILGYLGGRAGSSEAPATDPAASARASGSPSN